LLIAAPKPEKAMTEESLFHQALALPPTERAAFLDSACAGHLDLRVAVEKLLALHEGSGHPLDRPPVARADATGEFGSRPEPIPTSEQLPSDALPGIVIGGRYTLLEKIGEGGMGEVWVARQTEPIKRKVALKLIKAGMDSKSVLTRFEQERQALALMDHPNIAKVLDGGLTDDRRPFFVMELVNGLPLTRFCDEMKLGIRERLGLFVPICQAVQHAHQKGIVHRDLKPSNLLITLIDGNPVPKVIDFGVAKATGGKLTDETMSTQFGAVIGTLEYMSPEQAGFSGADVDTRADIYSLGVILYELLTGLRPFDSTRLKKAAFDEMIRMIREQEPSKPSTRLSTDEALPSLAASRQMEPGRLTKLLRGELDWVVMKCLEKQRDRRYETASGLARDVQRYLADEAVEARPPSAGYRLRKFVKRNKGRVIAAGIVFLALIGGIVGTTFGLIRAEEEKGRAIAAEGVAVDAAGKEKTARLGALDEQKKAERAAEAEKDAKLAALDQQKKAEKAAEAEKAARVLALVEKKKAEEARDVTAEQRKLALDTVRDVLLRVDELMKNDAKLAPLRIEIIRRMLEDVDRIRDHANKNPLEDRTEAIAYSRMGEIYFKTNRIRDSLEWYQKGYKVLKTLSDENPKNPNYLRSLATISQSLAATEFRMGNGDRSRELLADALRLRQLQRTLIKGAEEIELASADFDIAETYSLIAYDDLRLGDPKKAVQNYLTADAAFAALPPPMPNFVKTRRIQAEIQVRLGDARSRLNQNDEALKHYLNALAAREEMLRNMPRPAATASLLKTDIGQSRMYLGDYYLMARRQFPPAFAEYSISLKIFADQLREEPDNLDLRQRVSAALYRIGVTAELLNAPTLVAGPAPLVHITNHAYAECLRLRKDLAHIDTRDAQGQVELLLAHARLGHTEDAERIISGLMSNAGDDKQVLFQIACGYAIMGGGTDRRSARWRDKCFDVLNKLADRGWRDRTAFNLDPDLESIRADKRYADFLNRFKQ
jgi:serine/threonine protein kinase/tetratricopeptide (TPR) repeat protein